MNWSFSVSSCNKSLLYICGKSRKRARNFLRGGCALIKAFIGTRGIRCSGPCSEVSTENEAGKYQASDRFRFPRTQSRTHYGRRIRYYSNHTATLQIEILRDGDIEPNPGKNRSNNSTQSNTRTNSGRSSNIILHINSRSLLRHIHELRLILKDQTPSLIAITETWLDSTIHNIEVEVGGYRIERLDRNRHGGGICLYIAEGIKYKRRADLETQESEILWIDAKIGHTKLIFGCVYRPPNNHLDIFDHLEDSIREIRRSGKQEVILIGDFNCDCTNTSLRQTQRLRTGWIISTRT